MAPPRVAVGQNAEVQSLLKRGRKTGADVDQMEMVARRARQRGLSAEATASLLRPAVALAEQNLPARPLLSKTLEGLAKGVPVPRMHSVLQQYQVHTEQAGQIVTQWTQQSEVRQLLGAGDAPQNTPQKAPTQLVTAVAEAQQQNIPAQDLKAFLKGLPNKVERRPVSLDQVATAVNVLPDLPGNGTSSETARQLLTSALNADYSPESLRKLPSALQSAHQESKQPVDALAQGAAQAIARGIPATAVLQSLFQGGLPGGGPPAGTGPPGRGPGTGKPPDTGPPDGKGPPDDPPGGGDPPDDPGGGPPS
ncbi:MAG: hypothetical protein ABEL51_06870 [Salinibacter sp.]